MPDTYIESQANPLLKELRKLRSKKGRQEQGRFLVEGLRFVDEAVSAGAVLDFLIFTKEFFERERDFVDRIPVAIPKICVRDLSLLEPLCSTENPQGIVAVARMQPVSFSTKGTLIVLADQVQDPGNMGTIIRTAHAAGASAVLIGGGSVDVYNDKVLRSTMGSIFSVPVWDDPDFALVDELKKNGWRLAVSSLQATCDLYDEDLFGKIIVAVGNEANGVSSDLEAAADICVRIPMPGGAESLNVSVAAAVMIFEKLRRDRAASN